MRYDVSVYKLFSICMVLTMTSFGAFTLCCYAGGNVSKLPSTPAGNAGQGVSLRVLWTVSSFHIMDKATWGENEARAMLFKPLDISETSITFDGQTCRDVVFTSESVDAAQYFRERFRGTPQSLGLNEETIRVVKTTCQLPGFDEYVRLSDRRLLVPIQGILFFFTPAVNY